MIDNNLITSLESLSNACLLIKNNDEIIEKYHSWVQKIKTCIDNGNKIFFCGNGGSFADSQHLVAELIVRFESVREPIKAICLGANQSNLTAIGNDFTYEEIFVRELSALYDFGDIVFILSTSGNSPSVVKVANFLIEKNTRAIALLGRDGGKIKDFTDCIILPFQKTSLIQEIQILIGHSLCRELEEYILNKN